MAKKKSWFNIVKRFFISETKPNTPEKKEKRKRWLFGRLKNKRYPAITAPTASKDKALSEAEEEQSKNAMTVAIPAAADADADVLAGEVAGEIVRVNGAPQSTGECERTKEELQMEFRIDAPQSTSQCEKEILDSAATKIQTCEKEILESASIRIQTAFRGYLARKALRALKGIVRLQALIRGRNVRRQAINTLKCLQSIVNIQTQVCAKRSEKGSWLPDENKELQTLRDTIIKMDLNSQIRWDDSTLTKAEADAMFQSKKEAILKRERIKEYLFQHRRSAESERNKPNGRWRYWLDQWVDTQLSKSKELEDLDSIWTSSNRNPMLEQKGKGLRLKNLQRQNHNEELNSPGLLLPGRPFHRKQTSLGDHENSFSPSPVVPTYMAATESAKAKARSLSSPRTRPGSYDTSSDSHSPYKNKLCLVSSVTNDMSSRGKIGRSSAYQQRSPSLKGFQGPVKSSKTVNDLSINSECSLLNLDGQSLLR